MSIVSDHVEAQQSEALTRATLPRVNLLPPEIAERARFRRIQAGLGLGLLGAVGVVALLYVGASGSVDQADAALASSTATGQSLQAEATKYSEVSAVYARAEQAQGMLTTAMSQEVQYSTLMNNLSMSVPENIWVKDVTFTQTEPTAPGAAAATVPADGASTAGIGSVSFEGTGFQHDDVAAWLDSLAKQKGYVDPYFASSTEVRIGTRTAIDFKSTVTMTTDALSGKYPAKAGG